jgi:4'-phosphopantetheinyl transferase
MDIINTIDELPILGKSTIHIWGAKVPDLEDRVNDLKCLLNEEEAAKAERFRRPADRSSSIIARGALRLLLSGYTDIPASEIKIRYSENGKPLLVPQASRLPRCAGAIEAGRQDACDTISFNVSHSGEWVVLAFGRGRQLGVDVEKIQCEMDVLSIASRYFTPDEAESIGAADDVHALFFHYWARKEAYVKALGSGLFRELSSFSVPQEDGEKNGWFFQRLEAGSKYAAAVVTDKPVQDMPCFDFGGLQWDS